jgi:hypothetical protein
VSFPLLKASFTLLKGSFTASFILPDVSFLMFIVQASLTIVIYTHNLIIVHATGENVKKLFSSSLMLQSKMVFVTWKFFQDSLTHRY